MSSHDGSGALLGRLWTSPTASWSLCKSSKEGENCANVVWQDCLHCLHGHSLAAQRLNTVALDLTSCEAVFPATFRGRFADLGDGLEISSPGFSVLGKDGQVSQACAYSTKGSHRHRALIHQVGLKTGVPFWMLDRAGAAQLDPKHP